MREPIEVLINEYQRNLFAAAFSICKNAEDANDVVQETFIQYYTSKKEFEDEQHLKAWLIRVAVNKSKDITRSFWRRNKVNLPPEELPEKSLESCMYPVEMRLFDEVMRLPEKTRIVIHQYYYEDMSVREIAHILMSTEGAVKMRLSRGRNMLKASLQEEWSDDE